MDFSNDRNEFTESTNYKNKKEMSSFFVFFKCLWLMRLREKNKMFFVLYIIGAAISIILLLADQDAKNSSDEVKYPTANIVGNSYQFFISSYGYLDRNRFSFALAPLSSSFMNAINSNIQAAINYSFTMKNNIEEIRDYFYENSNYGLGCALNGEFTGSDLSLNLIQKDLNAADLLGLYLFTNLNALNESLDSTNTFNFSFREFAHPAQKAVLSFSAITGFYVILGFFYLSIASISTFYTLNKEKIIFYLNVCGLGIIKFHSIYATLMILDNIPLLVVISVVMYIFPKSISGTNFLMIFLSTLFFIVGRVFLNMICLSLLMKINGYVIHFIIIIIFPVIFMILSLYHDDLPSILFLILSIFSPSQGYLQVFYIFTECKRYYGALTFDKMNIAINGISMVQAILVQIGNIIIYFFLMVLFILNCAPKNGHPLIGWKNIFNCKVWKDLFSKSSKYLKITPESKEVVSFKNVSKTYKGHVKVHALKNVSFDIFSNELIVLIGPNGSGKSTLIDSLIGSILTDKGKIKFHNKTMRSDFSQLHKTLGIVFQDNVLIKELTLHEHFELVGSVHGLSKSTIDHQEDILLSMLELTDSKLKTPETLSGGQKRKLCIALALIHNPSLIVFDEPTAGTDAQSRMTIWKTLSNFKNTTSLVTSHSLEESESVCNRIFVMIQGNLSFKGTPADLRLETDCGYLLTITEGEGNINNILQFIQRTIPEAKILDNDNRVVYIPSDLRVADLLDELEASKEELGISKYLIHIQNLEESLIKLIQNEEALQQNH